ncbi:hypothetical protein CAEBREN_17023 [Caenorhabditis brenneri]|uniref:Uncharacterized protein n=1 Tax=Caenorhabditis brenneri TaxID=135651 RepID=G0MMD4_CAEBE|nr:hypothetical protein CAEBREN_17023 [Caenorhabditis brenneri]
MNQSNWYSQQQPYPGYEEQELENSQPSNQSLAYQTQPTAGHHFYSSKPAQVNNQHYFNRHEPQISTGTVNHHHITPKPGKTRDQRLAAAKQRYRQIPRDTPAPSQPWNSNSDPSLVGYQPSYAENGYGGYSSTPGSTGFMPHQYSSNHPLPSEHQVPPTPQPSASPAPSSQENDLRNERRRQMERQRRQKDNEILARAEYSRDPILLEQAEMIRAKRKRKEDRAQMRYKMMSDDKKEELRQRKRMQQRMRDLKKMQEE